MQMRRLESLLERQLFQRTGRGVVPTAEGEILLGYATRILALGDEAMARLQQTEISGGLRIGLAEEVAARVPAFPGNSSSAAYGRIQTLATVASGFVARSLDRTRVADGSASSRRRR
jgi:DNA-binding transcriptional LysR family regulator